MIKALNKSQRFIAKLVKLQKKNPVAGIVMLSIVAISSLGITTSISHLQEASVVNKPSGISSEKKSEKKPAVDSPTDLASASPAPTSASPKPAYHSIDAEKERRRKDTSWMDPLRITRIDTGGGFSCHDTAYEHDLNVIVKVVDLYIQRSAIWTNSHKGGTIHWQVEARKNGAITILHQGSSTIPDMNGVIETPNLHNYTIRADAPETAIRLKVTSPNVVASNWYTATPPDCYRLR